MAAPRRRVAAIDPMPYTGVIALALTESPISPGSAELENLRARTLDELRAHMSERDIAGARECAARLHAVLPERDRLDANVVLVAYGGGKDSSYTLAFVRAVQLVLNEQYGSTFRLRSVTNRHAGMPFAVMSNIERAYRALHILDDPGCEALLVDNEVVKPYRLTEPLAKEVVERNRVDLLMTGHRTGGAGRPTFCNACNLSMVNSFGLAAAYDGGVDVVITGDSSAEQRAYYLWVNRLAHSFGDRRQRRDRADGAGFRGFLQRANDIAGAYFAEIYGADAEQEIASRRVMYDVPRQLRFFSIYEDTGYSSSQHWRLLTDFLGFQFDEIAFSFTESDCGNPTLMAHLRGLACERLYGRDYAEGLAEYLNFAERLMRRKEFPEQLIEMVRQRYTGPDAAERMRDLANRFAAEAYGLTEEQLICMVYAPFPGKGERLVRYLEREQPGLVGAVDRIRALLEAERGDGGDPDLEAELSRFTGLELDRLRTLYRSPIIDLAAGGRSNLLSAILAGDPHKETIETRHSPDGPVVHELISGR